MLDFLRQRFLQLISPTSEVPEFLADSLYVREERIAPLERGDDAGLQSVRSRIVFRLFGLIWLVYVVSAFPALWHEHLSPTMALLAWVALLAFTLSYVLLVLLGTPLWATTDPRSRHFNRAMIGTQAAGLATLAILLPSWDLGMAFIYASVSAGIFLARREAIRVIAAITIVSVLTALREGSPAGDVVTAALLVGGIGLNSLFWSALMAQNRALRRARAEITRLAVSEERLRIARDLHDLLGHNLSLIALKSELASRLLAAQQETATRRAATEIADVQQVARTALQEVREAVAGYRMPSLAGEIANSVQILQAAGVRFSPRIEAPDLPMDLDRALAWFVREGTTNIIRHAHASTASLRIDRLGDRVFAEYIDNGQASSATPPASAARPGGSFGLIGLAERMRELGGELSAGPMPERGFRLHVILPIAAPSDAEPVASDRSTSLEPAR